MKILEITKLYYPWIGGVEKAVQDITEGLNDRNHTRVEVLCCQPKGPNATEKINGIKIYKASSFGIFKSMPISFSFFAQFRKLTKDFDLLAIHQPFPLADLAVFFFRPKQKIIVHYHFDIYKQKIFGLLLKPFALHTLEKAEKIIVSNPNMIKNSTYLEKFEKKCVVIPFGTDIQKIQSSIDSTKVAEIRKKYGDFVLFVGRLSYYKGVQYLIEAMKEVSANLVIIGSGQEEKRLKNLTAELGLEKRVFFLGHQPDRELYNYYKAASVFVLPSIYKSEAFGIVLIEAMACGTPLVTTEIGTGTSWINENDETGFVVTPKDPTSLSNSINKILEDSELEHRFSQNCKKRANSLFTHSKLIKIHYKLIGTVLCRSREN
ncbi:MAG: glycosyltransferase [bacterium]|nr:glycosyltransferase [bacterium]